MNRLLTNEQTGTVLANILKNPPQSILLIGPHGSGKETISKYVAADIIGTISEKLNEAPFYTEINRPEGKQDIPLDNIRVVLKNLSLKSPKKRVVLIKQAELLNLESQNTMLKIVEEPPENCMFIMNVPSQSQILPTIVSRSQKIHVLPVSHELAIDFYKDRYPAQEIDSAWNLSRGYVGLMSALLQDSSSHPLKEAVGMAKEFIRQSRNDRLNYLENISKDKEAFDLFLDALARVLSVLSLSAVRDNKSTQARKLLAARRMISDARNSLSKNTSVKLVSLNLALSLPV